MFRAKCRERERESHSITAQTLDQKEEKAVLHCTYEIMKNRREKKSTISCICAMMSKPY